MSISDWVSTEERMPESPGIYRVKYEEYRFGKLVESGEAVERFEDYGEFELSYLEDEGLVYRRRTHWKAIED